MILIWAGDDRNAQVTHDSYNVNKENEDKELFTTIESHRLDFKYITPVTPKSLN